VNPGDHESIVSYKLQLYLLDTLFGGAMHENAGAQSVLEGAEMLPVMFHLSCSRFEAEVDPGRIGDRRVVAKTTRIIKGS